MNKQTRKEIEKLVESLDEIKCSVENIQADEEEKYDNLPESIQDSDRGDEFQNAIDTLEGAAQSIEEAIDYLNEITEGWPMDEITIKVSMEHADHILQALKYFAVHSPSYRHNETMLLYENVKRQIENQW